MATTTKRSNETKRGAPSNGLILAGLLALAGIGAWIYQLAAGMVVTGLGQQVVWGLYIAAFFTAVGAGAGLLSLAAVSEFSPAVSAKARPGLLALALSSFIAGGLLITMDVGSPVQLWRLVSAFRFSSLMTWDFWLLVAAGLVTLAYLFQKGPAKGLGVVGIAAAVAVVVVEGWMLSALAARPLWGGGLTVVSFLVGALTAGLGLASLVLGKPVRTWLLAALAASLVLVAVEVLSGLVAGSNEVTLLLLGSAAPVFWLHILAGLVLPIGLLLSGVDVKAAGILAVFGVLLEKVWLLAAGQAQPWLSLPLGSYLPSWVELLAVAGVVGLGVLIFSAVKGYRRAG